MQRLLAVLAAGLTAAVLVAGCSNLTSPPGDDPRNLPQVADRGEVARPRPAMPGQPAASGDPAMPRIMRPPMPMRPPTPMRP